MGRLRLRILADPRDIESARERRRRLRVIAVVALSVIAVAMVLIENW